jgi:ribonuclease G
MIADAQREAELREKAAGEDDDESIAETTEEAGEEAAGTEEVEEAEEISDEIVDAAAAEPGVVNPETGEPIEPARKPVSLTAALREQGQRYGHRVSRRMRRKGRPEGSDSAAAAAPETPETREEPSDSKTAPRSDRPQVSITDLLREGQEIIVQIAKEPLGQKGARITSHIAMPGRYVVFMPTLEHMGVSRKIASDEERQRLKRILQTHRVGMTGGFILRTAGEGRTEQEIAGDMTFLYSLWQDIRQKAEKRKAPLLLHHDLDIVQRVMRDQFTESFKAIWTDSEEIYESLLRFVQRFQPTLVGRVKLYTRPEPIFDAFNVTQELEKALRPKVWLKSGGYIVINQTEALVAIDVNTGKFVGKSNRLEDTIVKTNTEAVKEIVRQMRLRDLGGIIVVDFIDMDERKNRQKVMQTLEEAMRSDRAPYKILQFNDFGLVAITRKRVKQSLERTLCSPCPYCEGAGHIKSIQTVVGEILQEAHKIARAVDGKDVILRVNPEVAKVLKSTGNKYLEELEGLLGRPVLVRSDANLHQEKFDMA